MVVFAVVAEMKLLCKLSQLAAKTKYLVDLGSGPVPYVIMLFSFIGASDKIAAMTGLPSRAILIVGVPLGALVVFTLGVVLDKVRFPHHYQEEVNRRNEMLQKISEK